MSTLFLTRNTEWCTVAEKFLTTVVGDVETFRGEWGDALPQKVSEWRGKYIISFLSPWILPQRVLGGASVAAINFHPGPPEYPGIGCYNFALYDEVREYGVTCHHMSSAVDSGALIRVRRFPVMASDSVATLKDRSMVALLELIFEVGEILATEGELPSSSERWQRRPYTRKELNQLGQITADMPADEVRRRYRAMHFPPYPGVFLDLGGIRFRA